MTDTTTTATTAEWDERQWPDNPRQVTEHTTARALVPDATGEGYEDRDSWLWHTTSGSVAAVARANGSVHETRHPFGSLKDAAVSFRAYWPAGLAAEHQAGIDLENYIAAKRGELIAVNHYSDGA
jgi:hypothetical protein